MKKTLPLVLSFGFMTATMMFASPVNASALTRSNGDYWTWEMSTTLQGVDVHGNMTYGFDGSDSISVNGTSYDVSIMGISGTLSGSTTFLGLPLIMNVTLGGSVFEMRDSVSIVKEDRFVWMNVSWGNSGFMMTSRSEIETMSSYSPPTMLQFHPGESGPGDSWTDVFNITTITTTWRNGTVQNQATTYDHMSYSVLIASSTSSVNTLAGTFEALRITATDPDGNYEINSYSDEVKNVIKYEAYESGSATPSMSMSLSSYHISKPVSLSTLVLAGIGIMAVVVALIVILALMMRRKGRTPQPSQPIVPPQAPPAQ